MCSIVCVVLIYSFGSPTARLMIMNRQDIQSSFISSTVFCAYCLVYESCSLSLILL